MRVRSLQAQLFRYQLQARQHAVAEHKLSLPIGWIHVKLLLIGCSVALMLWLIQLGSAAVVQPIMLL